MKNLFLTIALTGLTIGLLSSCTKEEGPENHNQNLPEGALPGVFSVSSTKKVNFSQGNLYYDGSEFKFETNQYDYPGTWKESHVGYFYWSKDASVAYSKVYRESDPADSDVFFSNATYETANPDFTVNGVTGRYRTLSAKEWEYLLTKKSRMKKGGPCYTCFINDVSVSIEGEDYYGVFIYPDNYKGNVVSDSITWEQINEAGIVFLPAAGFYDRSTLIPMVWFPNGFGDYWSSSANGVGNAYHFEFFGGTFSPSWSNGRNMGYSVRLVTE